MQCFWLPINVYYIIYYLIARYILAILCNALMSKTTENALVHLWNVIEKSYALVFLHESTGRRANCASNLNIRSLSSDASEIGVVKQIRTSPINCYMDNLVKHQTFSPISLRWRLRNSNAPKLKSVHICRKHVGIVYMAVKNRIFYLYFHMNTL